MNWRDFGIDLVFDAIIAGGVGFMYSVKPLLGATAAVFAVIACGDLNHYRKGGDRDVDGQRG